MGFHHNTFMIICYLKNLFDIIVYWISFSVYVNSMEVFACFQNEGMSVLGI